MTMHLSKYIEQQTTKIYFSIYKLKKISSRVCGGGRGAWVGRRLECRLEHVSLTVFKTNHSITLRRMGREGATEVILRKQCTLIVSSLKKGKTNCTQTQ